MLFLPGSLGLFMAPGMASPSCSSAIDETGGQLCSTRVGIDAPCRHRMGSAGARWRETRHMTAPWLVISPHFDDAVLSCGHLLARSPGSIVLTVCSGIAPSGVAASDWDEAGGFATAEEATLGRRGEDAKALRVLGASQVTADILDGPYRTSTSDVHERATHWIETVIDEVTPQRIVIPLGSPDHGDHVLTREVAMAAARTRRPSDTYLYADLPYFIGRNADGMAETFGATYAAQPEVDVGLVEKKAAALSHYRSQLVLLAQSFGGHFGAVFIPGVERMYAVDTE